MGACSPDARWVALAGDGTGQIVTLSPDAAALDTLRVPANPTRPNVVRFGRGGGALFVLTAVEPATLLQIRREDGKVLASFGLTTPAHAFRLDRKGRRAIVAAGGSVQFIWIADNSRSRTLEACDSFVVDLVSFEEAARLFAVCADGAISEIDTRLETVLRTEPPGADPCPPSSAALARSGTILLIACDAPSRLRYVDRVTLTRLDDLPLTTSSARLIVGGDRGIVLGDDVIVSIDLRARTIVETIQVAPSVRDAVVAPDGGLFVLASDDARARLYRLDPADGSLNLVVTVDSPMRSVTAWPEATPVFNW